MKYLFIIILSFVFVSAKADRENVFKQIPFQGFDTLNILISVANNIYYYISPLAENASNFKITLAKYIRDHILFARADAKKKGDSLIIFLKIQKTRSLSDESKEAVDFIKKQPGYEKGILTRGKRN